MAPSLLHPPSYLSPAEALQLSQQAPTVLANSPSTVSSSPFISLLNAPDSPELWMRYENLLLSCLRTSDPMSAHQCLERLVKRFGAQNERVMALQGLLKESDATDDRALEAVLKEYDQILRKDSTNIPITKRKIALLRSLGRTTDAIGALNALLDFSPTDAEAWAELADIYYTQGMYAQAIYAQEEVLTIIPNAWNVHARLGELLYMAATASGAADGSLGKYLAEALKRFCRSIELCDDYLRGYYGLKLVTNKLLKESPKGYRPDAEDFALPNPAAVEKLNEMATEKLSEIVRRYGAGEAGWRGYDEGEISAAKELVGKEAQDISR